MDVADGGFLSLDTVLLGSGLRVGIPEIILLVPVAIAWLLFGVWSWRLLASRPSARLVMAYTLAAAGLMVTTLAGDVLLFYSGVALSGYAGLAVLLRVHGAGHARTAAVHALLLVLGDLILFELFVHLYSKAQSIEFAALQKVYRTQADGLSFSVLLMAGAAGCCIAPLLLLLPLPGSVPAWRPGAAWGLLCTAATAGVWGVTRLAAPVGATEGVWQALPEIAVATLALLVFAELCVRGWATIRAGADGIAGWTSQFSAAGVALMGLVGTGAQRLVPRLQAIERVMLSWSVAVPLAVAFAVILALVFVRSA